MHGYILQLEKMLDPLNKINPMLQHIELDKKKGEAFPELLTVLRCHTPCSDFMIRFSKQPLVENCDCKACIEGMFKPVPMPLSVYEKV